MKLRSILAATSGLLVALAPVVASANPASALSVASNVRASAPAKGASRFAAPGSVIGLVLFAAVIAGGAIILATDDDDDPDSP